MHCAILTLCISLILKVTCQDHEDAQNEQPNADLWDYEPLVWSPDDVDEDGFWQDQNQASSLEDTIEDSKFGLEDGENPPADSSSDSQNARRKNYYLEPDLLIKRQHNGTSQEQKCTQFRVDTREAVVCDKKRCDKFDFEWPKYDNQIALIETTRHGMRFHRVDLAFAPNPARNHLGRSPSGGKFDIFDLFKPKPAPVTSPSPQTTTTQTDATTTPTDAVTTEPANNTRDLEEQDTNNTQLVTTFRLDTRRRKQTIIGFGGALSDSTCRNIKSLSSAMSKSLMEDYYGDRGLMYNIARLSIGSSDFSTTPYTNNDKPQSSRQVGDQNDDVEMNNFRLTDEDYEFKLPVARQAIATSRREIKFFASLWSPPIWMKNNSHIVHGYLKGDVYGPYYKALAELMIKWLEAYRKNGLEFWGLTGLNEPITGVKPFIFHNSLGITRDDYVTFYKLYLGPMLRQRGFHNLKLIFHDDNKGYAPNWVKTMLEDPVASKYVSGIGIHWYMNDEYENLDFISKRFSDKFILSTEACNGYLPFQVHALPGNWDRGIAYMYDIIKVLHKNVAGWVDWNMALDLAGGPSWAKNNLDAAIIVNARRDEYYKSPMFYAIGHFSRFVEANSTRLDQRLANARYDYPLEAVAFHTPKGYIVIVAMNANKHSVPFKIIVDKQLIRMVTLRSESFSTIVFKWKMSN